MNAASSFVIYMQCSIITTFEIFTRIIIYFNQYTRYDQCLSVVMIKNNCIFQVFFLNRKNHSFYRSPISILVLFRTLDTPRVAFTSQISLEGAMSDVKRNQTIVFDLVEYNMGGAYDPTTGKFKAQVSGTYVFFFNILTRPHMRLGVDLTINGETRSACAYSGADPNFSVNGSNMVVVHLNQGDEVWVRAHKSRDPPPGVMLSSFANSFAGFLLYSD